MPGEKLQKAFVVIYVLIILNLLFWLFSLVGLLVLGFGPALRTVNELYLEHKYNYRDYHFKQAWNIYKSIFVKANLHFYCFALIGSFLIYDLYLASQIRNPLMLPIAILLIFLVIVTIVVGFYTLLIESTFDTNFKNALKVSFYAFFSNLKSLLAFVAGAAIIIFVSKLWPGLILFFSISGMIIWCEHTSREWINTINEKI